MSEPAGANASIIGWIGRFAGPLLAGCIAVIPSGWLGELSADGQTTAAITVWMAVWWMTEAIPLPATSLLPLVLFPLTGVLSLDAAAAPYANKYVFLFLGGFMVARAVERWNLHRRIALLTVCAVGTQPTRLVAGFMLATAALSMWISNTAATVMMLPIGMSLVTLLRRQLQDKDQLQTGSNFALCLMLGIAYSASIGGLATLVGTPTNLLLAGFLKKEGIELSFASWMQFAFPLSIVLLVMTWIALTRFIFPLRIRHLEGGRQLIVSELRQMGRVSRGEWTVLIVFLLTATCWVFRQPLTGWQPLVELIPAVGRLDDTLIAMIGAASLFLIPIDARRGVFAMDWETASTIPWGVLLLFGGGFCLAAAITASELSDWIGAQVYMFRSWPTICLILVVVTMVVFLTELTSNTPTAAAFLPILFSVAVGLNVAPMRFLVPATLGATCAFMLPVATPPNAIVFGSGCIEIKDMAKAGFWINLMSIALITLWMYLFGGFFDA